MTWKPTDEELKMLHETEKWMQMDENGNWSMREDAPKEAKEFNEKFKKKYSIFE
ncbi:MAG: hypothetical protein ACI4F8_09885 [Lachnospiraceae bacterium]